MKNDPGPHLLPDFAILMAACKSAVVLMTMTALLCLACASALPQTAVPKPTPEVQALLDQGMDARNGYRWEEALRLNDTALAKARERQDRVGEGMALHSSGNVYLSISQTRKALEYFQQALPIYQTLGDKKREANVLIDIGNAYGDLGQLQKSLDYYQQALSLRKTIGDRGGEAAALTNIGTVYAQIGKPQQALDCFQQALPLHREMGNQRFEANTLGNIGRVYSMTGRPEQALDYFQQALPLFIAIQDKRGEANTLTNIGYVYSDSGRPQQALEYFQKALPLCKAIGDRRGEANILNNIGILCGGTGQSRQALEYFQQALSLRKEIGDREGEAATLTNIGNIYMGTDQSEQALNYFQQALPLHREVGNRLYEANTLVNIGHVYMDMTQPQKALDYYRQALSLHQEIDNKHGQINTLYGIGSACLYLGQPQQALEYFQQALPLCRATGNKRGEANVLTGIGFVYEGTGKPQQALNYFQQALPLHREVGNRRTEAYTLGNIASQEQSLGRLADAETHYVQAVALFETLRANLGGYAEAKTSFLAAHLDIYYAYLDFLLQRSKTADAFALAQKTKARDLLDLLYDGKVDLSAVLSAEERGQERELRQRADALDARMVNESVENLPGAKQRFATLEMQLREVESHLQALTDTLYARHPDLAAKRVATTASLADVARFLPEDTALLEYLHISDNKLALFVVTKRHQKAELAVYPLSVNSAALAAQCADFHAACADLHKDYRPLARSLYRLLVQPAGRELAGKKRLVVCPEGPLWDVPFQALLAPPHRTRRSREETERFLADRFEIAYAYSATGALAAWEMHERHHTPPSGSLLAFANPDFGSASRFGNLKNTPDQRPFDRPSRPFDRPSRPFDRPSRPFDRPSRAVENPEHLMTALAHGTEIAPLPGTQREAEALRSVFPDAVIYTGTRAQAETARRQAGQYRYLHFATHGFFNDAAPLLSAIVLAQPPPGSTDSGFLTARDLFGLTLHADLVVLSACNTARGDVYSGEGIIGMTWALFVAGAPTQVVSQWSVDDASTAALMQQFYGNLKAGQMKGKALQSAASSLRRAKQYRHPYYWAPFILMGDWR